MLISPEAPTNVYCVENVACVQWSVFGADITAPDRRSWAPDSAFSTLDQAWSDFVRHGYHACHAFRAKVLWVFELSSSLSSGRHQVPLNNIAQKHQLKKISFGVLRACDLELGSRFPQHPSGPSHSQRPSQNGQGSPLPDTQSPTTTEFDPKGTDALPGAFQPTTKQVYDAFITATYELLLFDLASNLTVIPLCANFFVHLETQHSHFHPSTNHSHGLRAGSQPPIFHVRSSSTIGVEWLPSGRLLVAVCPARASVVPLSANLRLHDTVPWTDCYIAPFGIKLPPGSVRRKKPEMSMRRPAVSGKQSQRQAIISMLERRGIHIHRDEEWVICYFQPHNEGFPHAIHGRCLMWPSSLVFVQASSVQLGWWYNSVRPQDITDPFDTLVSQVEPKPDKSSRTVQIDNDSRKEDNDPFAYIVQNTHAGGLNFIYPTPPDHLRSQPTSQAHRPSAFSAPTPATVSSVPAPGDGETPSVLQDVAMSPERDVDIRLGDADDHDDLFGDLALQMGTGAIHDDDFGFFDVQRPPTRASGTEAHDTGDPVLSHSPTLTFGVSSLKEIASLEPSSRPIDDEQPQEDVVMQDVATPAVQPSTTISSPESVRDVPRRPMTMDDKYVSGGLYSQKKSNGPMSRNPREPPPFVQSIPIITKPSLKHDLSDSSSDDTSDDSDYNDNDYNNDDDDEDDDYDEENEFEDEDEDMYNANNESDTSMEPGMTTPSDTVDATPGKHRLGAPAFLPIDELAKARMPMLVCPSKQLSKTDTSKVMSRLNIKSEKYIELAQLVSQQLCYFDVEQTPGLQRSTSNQISVSQIVEKALDKPNVLDVESWASVVKITKQTEASFSPSAFTDDANIQQLRPSDVVVDRDGSLLIMSSASLSIWIELGLAPEGGPQDVQCYCFTPDLPVWLHGAKGILEMMHDTFASMRLGRHDLGTIGANNSLELDGVVGIAPAESFEEYTTNLTKAANSFDKLIRSSEPDEHTDIMIIYIVNPAPAVEVHCLPPICSVFQRLQHSLHQHDITLVLKILPGNMVAQDGALSIPMPHTLIRLAREMYERISQADGPPLPLTFLAPPLPTSIPMRLEANPARRPLDSETVLHLAYSWSVTSPWLTFALTDALGKTKYSSAYYIPWRNPNTQPPGTQPGTPTANPGTPNNTSQPPTPGGPTPSTPSAAAPSRPPQAWGKDSAMGRFVEAIKHLWTSLDKLFPHPKSGMHKLIVVKDSPPVHPTETHVWKMLGTSRASMDLVFLIIDPDCPITLTEPPAAARRHPTRTGGSAEKAAWNPDRMDTSGLSGPSTPAHNPAPAAHGFPGVNKDPSAEDPSARLVRPADEAWAVESKSVFACSLVGKLEVIQGALGCGYLIMREPGPGYDTYSHQTAGSDADGLEGAGEGEGEGGDRGGISVVSLRVQYAKVGPAGGGRVDMTAIMTAYRGLATVSEVVGLETRLPWHVATARRMRMGLSQCM